MNKSNCYGKGSNIKWVRTKLFLLSLILQNKQETSKICYKEAY